VSPELSITVAAAVTNSVFVEYIPQMEAVLKRPITRRDGYGIPFDAPGHGIEFDPDALERFTVRERASGDGRQEAAAASSHDSSERTR
jgi:L-alanine-DL-glutamate epimerase-like enolase superfamily enzyme